MLYFGTLSLLRRCFWPRNGGREIPKPQKMHISPYKIKNQQSFLR